MGNLQVWTKVVVHAHENEVNTDFTRKDAGLGIFLVPEKSGAV